MDWHQMLEDAKADDSGVMEVDTSYLDPYRRTGAAPDTLDGRTDATPETGEPTFNDGPMVPDEDAVADPRAASEHEVDGPDHDNRLVPDASSRKDRETGRTQTAAGSGSGGAPADVVTAGTSAPRAGTGAAAPGARDEPVEPHSDQANRAGQPESAHDSEDARAAQHEAGRSIPARRKSDDQDAVQALTSTGGVKGGSIGGGNTLPDSAFRVPGMDTPPQVRNLPRLLVDALRKQLKAAAMRERAVPEEAAEAFTRRLSQGALVTAFLLAQLDVRLDTDPATQTAAALFRSQDPLLGSVAERMTALEQLEEGRARQFERLQQELREVHDTAAVIEQAVAYSIADRTENFLRGSHDIHDAPIAHKDAIYIRDKAREETQKRAKFEQDRDGRPMR
ncbi:hypothetical protein KKI43_22580 [Arthrobacter sp. GN70]|uniref:Uncharacterized protein n=1 Tax=Arthrobacter terricola TaxID=2547396 RepID=A0A4R5K8R3_9MICC|nr:hypothetical protein [Arthrobacter sp. GN70]TDF91521.1 hypothetical protein E1809_20555 [Arthrobacter terricola]